MFFAHRPEYEKHLCVEDELGKELIWAQSRPNSLAYNEPPIDRADPLCFRKVLTASEELSVRSYSLKWPDAAYQLNQNPGSSFETHSSGQNLATLIKNCYMIYWENANPQRWMTGTEAICTQGFPVHPEVLRILPSAPESWLLGNLEVHFGSLMSELR